MNNRGSILFHRKTRDHWIWKDRVRATWWIDILCEVNYKPDRVNIGGKLIVCGRGQSVKSLRTWAALWGVSQTTVKRFFKTLERDRMISIENLKRTTRITVLKYDLYQKSMSQLTDTKSEDCKDTSYNVVTTCDENALHLTNSKSGSCESWSYNLDEKSVTNMSNEEVFKAENLLKKKEVELSDKKKYEKLPDALKSFSIKKTLNGEFLTDEETEKVNSQCRKYLTVDREEDKSWNEIEKKYTSNETNK